MMRRTLVLCVVLFGFGGCKPEPADGKADGPTLFKQICARCHGEKGVPPQANVARMGVKPLTAEHAAKMTDSDIRYRILNGSPNGQMPALRGSLSDAQIDAVIKHVRALQAEAAAGK